ncbi:MAG: hypothetical protein H6634_07560 [Anaerolineales bacterium]|nr:hypothetical protein [Anaerolineales bacterium]
MNQSVIPAGGSGEFDSFVNFQKIKSKKSFPLLRKLRIIVLIVFVVSTMVTGCSGSKNNLVGRWEFGDEDFGIAFEFYDDGIGFVASSIDPFEPNFGEFTYTYDPQSGIVKQTIEYSPEVTKERELYVTFLSKDEISIEQPGARKPMQFVRKPLPELPPGARSRIGIMLLGRSFEFIDAKELSSDWEKEYSNYTVVARTNIEMTVGEDAVWWLVTLQIEGDNQPRLFVLRKGEGRWGALELVENK